MNKQEKMFELLVEQHAPMLVSYLAALTGSKDEAEDAAQDAFVKAYESFGSFNSKRGSFATWLRSIGRNAAIDGYRKRRKVVPLDTSVLEGIEDVFRSADGYGAGDTWSERIAPLRECLGALPETLKAACCMHYMEGLSVKTVAERLGAKLQSVLKRLERARTALRKCIEKKLKLEMLRIEHGF